MQQPCVSRFVLTWQKICAQYSQAQLQDTQHFIQQHVDVLVVAFYQNMLFEPESAEFLSDELLQQRLQLTLKRWLIDTVSVALNHDYATAIATQQRIGQVHARIGIPSWLIIRGIRELQTKIFALQSQDWQVGYHEMSSYITQILSLSAEVMCRSYEVNQVKKQAVQHSYQVFSAMQDVAVHKDKQRSTLLNWENELMFKVFTHQQLVLHPLLSKSEFGLWFIHKAAYAFVGSTQVDVILQRIEHVDRMHTSLIASTDLQQSLASIQHIRQLNREIQHLIDHLFQVASYIESGNDPLTQLLNRRYLNTIISREINFSRKNQVPLSLLALDADHFKAINDQFGHASGDEVLKSIAQMLQKYSRGSDYVFRAGGEEFLLLLVDTTAEEAYRLAEKIRLDIASTPMHIVQGQQIKLTLSIGCAAYDGHPDYQKFLEAADVALYRAKNNGRNQVQVFNATQQLRDMS